MSGRRPGLSGPLVALAIFVAAVAGSPALGAPPDEKKVCVAAYEKAQQMRNEKKMHASREQLAVCARAVCPGFVRADCATWTTEVEAAMPSVVISAHDGQGNDVSAVTVSIDGGKVADKLDGKPIPVDPGAHTFRYEMAGASAIEEQVTLREGEHDRRVVANFAPQAGATSVPSPRPSGSSPTEPAPESGSPPVAAYVLGGVGVLALGGFALFAVTGKSAQNNLKSTCAPNCASSDVDSVRHKYLFADISLGVGVVALGVATVLLVTRSSDAAPPATSFDLRPAPGGASASFGGRF